MKAKGKVGKCLNPHCSRTPSTRGLCLSCYNVARMLVLKGKTTWAILEAAGKTSKSHREAIVESSGWFLEE